MNETPVLPEAHDETRRREGAEKLCRPSQIAAEVKANMPDEVTSDQSWLHDAQTGLPI